MILSSLKTISCCSALCITFVHSSLGAAESQGSEQMDKPAPIQAKVANIDQAPQSSFLSGFGNMFNLDALFDYCSKDQTKPTVLLTPSSEGKQEMCSEQKSVNILSVEPVVAKRQGVDDQAKEDVAVKKECVEEKCNENNADLNKSTQALSDLDEIGREFAGGLHSVLSGCEAGKNECDVQSPSK